MMRYFCLACRAELPLAHVQAAHATTPEPPCPSCGTPTGTCDNPFIPIKGDNQQRLDDFAARRWPSARDWTSGRRDDDGRVIDLTGKPPLRPGDPQRGGGL